MFRCLTKATNLARILLIVMMMCTNQITSNLMTTPTLLTLSFKSLKQFLKTTKMMNMSMLCLHKITIPILITIKLTLILTIIIYYQVLCYLQINFLQTIKLTMGNYQITLKLKMYWNRRIFNSQIKSTIT